MKSANFVEAQVDLLDEIKIRVIQRSYYPDRRVEITGPSQKVSWGSAWTCSDAFADIIVRGIRSLEEEKATRARGILVDQVIDYDAIERRRLRDSYSSDG